MVLFVLSVPFKISPCPSRSKPFSSLTCDPCAQETSPSVQNPISCKHEQQRLHPSGFRQIQAFASLLQNAREFSAGSIAHYIILHYGFADERFLSNLLIDLYGKCGALQDALYVFQAVPKRNSFTWNIIFSVLVQHEQSFQAFQLFQQMLVEGLIPDKFTYSAMVDACALMHTLSEGVLVHCMLAANECNSQVVVATALVNMYSKHSQLVHAKHAFNQVYKHDVVSWSAMIEAYANHGYESMSMYLFQQMQKEMVIPDAVSVITILGVCATFSTLAWGKVLHSMTVESGLETDLLVGNALVNMYAKCGNLEDALRVFEEARFCDVVSWTVMISAYNQAGLVKNALQVFEAMEADGIKPNAVAFVNVLSACSHEGMMEEGIFYFLCIYKYVAEPSFQHYGCLIDLFGRAGQLEEAEFFINSTEIRHSSATLQALLGACKVHNDVQRGRRVALCIIDLDPFITAPYVALSEFCDVEFL